MHVDAERAEWLPPIVAARDPFRGVQDEAFETFGTGSGNPLPAAPGDD